MPSSIKRTSKFHALFLLSLVAGVGISNSSAISAETNWPGWRGPTADGVTAEKNLPTEWSPEKNIKWKVALPGPGNSSPVVWEDKLWLTQAEEGGKKRSLICFEVTTGKELWRDTVTVDEPEPTHPTNPHCASSPVTDGKIVVAFLGAGGLVACDVNGKRLWEKQLGAPQHLFGQGASPVLWNDSVFLNYGPGTDQYFACLDASNGEQKWRIDIPHPDAPNPFDQPNGPKLPPGTKLRDPFGTWATPIVHQSGEKTEVILSMPEKVIAVEPETGKIVWECAGNGAQVLASPLIGEGKMVLLGGAGFALPLGGEGDQTAKRLWSTEEDRPRIGTGVIYNGKVIANTMQGIVEVLDLQSGERVWQKRLTAGGASGQSWSSLVRSSDKVYAINQEGATFVLSLEPEVSVVGTNELGESTNASPAISNGRIFIRTDKHLWCVEQSTSAS